MARLLPCSQLSLLSKSESVYRVGIQLVVCFCTIREIDVKGERRERERDVGPFINLFALSRAREITRLRFAFQIRNGGIHRPRNYARGRRAVSSRESEISPSRNGIDLAKLVSIKRQKKR